MEHHGDLLAFLISFAQKLYRTESMSAKGSDYKRRLTNKQVTKNKDKRADPIYKNQILLKVNATDITAYLLITT